MKILEHFREEMFYTARRLERGRFIWPQAEKGVLSLSRAQLSMLLEGPRGECQPGLQLAQALSRGATQ